MGNSCGRLGLAGDLDDRERDACLHRLGDHYAAGRLTADELDSRIQAALAATTEAELAAAMTGLSVDSAVVPDREQPPPYSRPARPRIPHKAARVAATIAALGVGGGLVAAVGQGSDVVEFLVGLAVGQLGFLTHWWLATGAGREDGAAVDQRAAAQPDVPDLSQPPPAGDDVPVQRDPRSGTETPPDRLRRPVGRGDGAIPTQRRGD